jgi:hypothetical protein
VTIALRATCRTLAAAVQAALAGAPELSGPLEEGALRVHAGSPAEAAGAGVHVWLYRVTYDDAVVNAPTPAPGPRPLAVRLHFLVAPVVDGAPALEQLILGTVMQWLHDHPVLPTNIVQDELAGTHSLVRVQFVELPLDTVTQLWLALGARYRASAAYEVTVTTPEQ